MRQSMLVGLALIFGAFTSFLVANWVKSDSSATPTELTKVAVASQPIEAGVRVNLSQIRLMEWSGSSLPGNAFKDAQQIVGRVTRYPIESGEVILKSKLTATDAQVGLAAVIAEGKRAISVRVNEVIGVAGFALPGNYVDVLVSGKDPSQQPFSRVVINRAKVLAVAQDTVADVNKPKVTNAVTLELSPTESEVLDLARSIGTLSLVLRNEADQAPWTSSGARFPDVLGASGSGVNKTSHQPHSVDTSSAELVARAKKENRSSAANVSEIRGLQINKTTP